MMLSGPHTFAIADSDFAFLSLQKGKLSSLAENREIWIREYNLSLFEDYKTMESFLPRQCGSVLDIGSGLGGIDALLNLHYGGDLSVCLLDGIADPPKMELHRKTFNDMTVARGFLERNGVKNFSFLDPVTANAQNDRKFDLIVSLGSYCFHYSPDLYLDLVKTASNPGTVLIFDFRKGKPDWRQRFAFDFSVLGFCKSSDKFDRIALRKK